MRIAIVDDISEERTLLRNRLEYQFSRRNVHVDIFEYENGETFLTAAKECPFTVVFLDIYMNGSNGIDTAKEHQQVPEPCCICLRRMDCGMLRSLPCGSGMWI